MKYLIKTLPLLVSGLLLSACCTTTESAKCPIAPCKDCPCPMTAAEYPCTTPGSKCVQDCKCPCAKTACGQKLTKEMFYDKDGKFNEAAAKDAYFDMMKRLGYPISENMRQNMWAIDFGLGDFPNVGMGGIFWAQENKHGVFGHEILLLPNQYLVEHWHVPADGLPAKNECWQARAGMTYCFGEEGEDMAKYSELNIPESQKKFFTQKKVAVADAKKGNIVWLNKVEARHSQMAGPEGAVVTEYGAFHGNNAQRFTNPDVKF